MMNMALMMTRSSLRGLLSAQGDCRGRLRSPALLLSGDRLIATGPTHVGPANFSNLAGIALGATDRA